MRAFSIELPRFRQMLAALLLAHLLAIMALAASPALHAWIHGEDAHHGEHGCAVVLFSAGNADAPTVAVVVVNAPLPKIAPLPVPVDREIESLFRSLRILEHAPPQAA